MNLLVVGVSHRTARSPLLERLAVGPADAHPRSCDRLVAQPYVSEAVRRSPPATGSRSTPPCPASTAASATSAPSSPSRPAATPPTLADHLYVHYDDAAVRPRLPGRRRARLDGGRRGADPRPAPRRVPLPPTERDAAGRLLHELMQQALRVGKRVHAETGIDRAGQSVVTAALDLAAARSTATRRPARRSWSAPARWARWRVATLSRLGAGALTVTNRGADRAAGWPSRTGPAPSPSAELTDGARPQWTSWSAPPRRPSRCSPVDVVTRRSPAATPAGPAGRARPGRAARRRAGVADAARRRGDRPRPAGRRCSPTGRPPPTRAAVERIVAGEVEAFLTWLRGADVAPTVAALRARADEVVDAELRRLGPAPPGPHRRPAGRGRPHACTGSCSGCCTQPTVRVRQLAAEPGGDQYAALLRELFDLDPCRHGRPSPTAGRAEIAPTEERR